MLLDGKIFAERIYRNLEDQIKRLNKKPSLGVILVGESEASIRYVAQKKKFAEQIGINFILKKFNLDVSEKELLNQINIFNNDKNISGFIVQLPLPKHIIERNIINAINPKKDVDGFHPVNQGKVILGDNSGFIPCTPAGIIELLDDSNITYLGKQVVVIGRSNIVGKPIVNLLINKGATVISCNSRTLNIKKFTSSADIIISVAGFPGLITLDMLKTNSVVIDVGFSIVGGKIYGDADTRNIDLAGIKITPVPGGVGALTVAMLMKNTLKAYKQNNF